MNISALIDNVVETTRARQCFTTREWTPEEEAFMHEHLADLGYEGVAQILGRSMNAVKVHQVRHQIPAPSKRPGWLTGHQAARILAVDIHSIMELDRRGILPFNRVHGLRGIMQIRRISLWVWAINPEHWIYFKMARVRSPRLRRLIELRKERWGDEWWTTGQVAEYYGLSASNSVNAAIHRGQISARQWGNWYIQRSDALAHPFYPGKGNQNAFRAEWSPRADAYILRARDELGMKFTDIAPRMKWDVKRVMYRYKLLKSEK